MSNNVGIDFTELGPPHGSKPVGTTQVAKKGQDGSVEKEENFIVVGFRVKPKEQGIIQDYANRMYSQYIVDPTAKQPKRMLDNPSSELVTRLVTFSYMTHFNCFLQAGTFQKSSFSVNMGIPNRQDSLKIVAESNLRQYNASKYKLHKLGV